MRQADWEGHLQPRELRLQEFQDPSTLTGSGDAEVRSQSCEDHMEHSVARKSFHRASDSPVRVGKGGGR